MPVEALRVRRDKGLLFPGQSGSGKVAPLQLRPGPRAWPANEQNPALAKAHTACRTDRKVGKERVVTSLPFPCAPIRGE